MQLHFIINLRFKTTREVSLKLHLKNLKFLSKLCKFLSEFQLNFILIVLIFANRCRAMYELIITCPVLLSSRLFTLTFIP